MHGRYSNVTMRAFGRVQDDIITGTDFNQLLFTFPALSRLFCVKLGSKVVCFLYGNFQLGFYFVFIVFIIHDPYEQLR